LITLRIALEPQNKENKNHKTRKTPLAETAALHILLKPPTINPMSELVYHDGHYHRVEHPPRGHRAFGVWRTTHDLWDEVLYGIGSVCHRFKGR
jgi:hypothetical protein